MPHSTGRNRSTVLIAHPSPDMYGSDRVLLETVTALTDAGYSVVVAIPHDGPLAAELIARNAEVAVIPMLVLRKSLLRPSGLVSLLGGGVRAMHAAWRAVAAVDPAVVYVNTLTIPVWPLVGRLRRRQVVVHVHEAEEEVGRAVRIALSAPLLLAHRIVVNSKATARVLTEAIPRLAQKIQLVYNGVPGPPLSTEPRRAITGPLRLVLVGRLSPRKGTDVAIRALAGVRARGVDATLDLVGSIFPGYEWYEQELRDLCRTADLNGAVTFTGFKDPIWDALAAADVALVPSRVEPFGNASVEAQLSHRPVIVSDTQGLVETVDNGRYGQVVAAGNADALADAIVGVVGAWPAARAVADDALRHAGEEFSTRRYSAEIVRTVGELAGPDIR